LAALLAAVDQELARVLEVIAVDDASENALGRNGGAIRGDHQRDLTLRDNCDRHFDDAVLPAPIAEVQSRRERVGLITRFAAERDEPPGRERARTEAFDDNPDLPFLDQNRAEHEWNDNEQ